MALAPNARKDLTEKQLSFVIWSATPEELRDPATQAEFGTLMGVNESTLWRWKKDPRVMDAIRYVVIQQAGAATNVKAVLDAVLEVALGGGQSNLKAAELWLKSVGVSGAMGRSNLMDNLDDETSFADFSTEELKRLRDQAEAASAEEVNVTKARMALAARGVELDDE